MAKAKYANQVQPLRLWTENVRPYFRGKMADFSLLFDAKVCDGAPLWVETFYAYAPGTGVGNPGDTPSYWKGEERDRSKGMQHSHNDFDELFLFMGSNCHDNTLLGGEVEFWLGDGADAQKWVIKEPTAKWVPKGVAHNPWRVNKVNDPKYPIIIMVIALAHTYENTASNSITYPVPPAYSKEMYGKPQPGKGKYSKLVNKLCLSQTINIPQLRGKASVPNLMFDDYVYRAPVWVEIFHVFAGGSGPGVPTLEPSTPRPGAQPRDQSKGMQHSQNFDELFLFISTDSHDILNLGGEVEIWLGDEKYPMTKSCAAWVPAGTPHNPMYYKQVERPYIMVVIALCDNAKFFEGAFSTTPAPKAFRM
jgi:mannose-6-phosphate isomerase-like protein (cupin superfamily)